MKIRLRTILAFVVVIVGISIAIMPSSREMIELLLESGKAEQAFDLAPKAVEKGQNDFALLVTAAEVYERKGEPVRAVQTMQRALELKPHNLDALERMAKYLIWNNRGKEALPYLERTLDITPDRPDLLLQLVNAYRYYGMETKESSAMARLIRISPRFDANKVKAGKNRYPFIRLVSPVLHELATLRLENGPDLLRDQTMRGIFVLSESYQEEVDDGPTPDLDEYLGFAIEQFVLAGLLEEAKFVASQWDEQLTAGRKYRHLYGKILLWNGLPGRAADYLLALAKQSPVDVSIMRTALEASITGQEFKLAENIMTRVMALNGESSQQMRELASIQDASEDTAAAATTYARLVSAGNGTADDVRKMLEYSLWSNDLELLQKNVALAEKQPTLTNQAQDQLAQAWLVLDKPKRAYPVFKSLYESTGDKEYVRQMVAAAMSSDDPLLDSEALQIAHNVFPGDIDLLRQMAETYMAAEQPELALPMLRRISEETGTAADLAAYIEAAGYTGKRSDVEPVAQFVEKRLREPGEAQENEVSIRGLLADVYGWVGLEERRAMELAIVSDKEPHNLQAALDAAEAADGAQNTAESIRLYERARSLAPHSSKILSELAERYLWNGNEDQAIRAYEALEDMGAGGTLPLEGRLLLARHAIAAERWADAVEYLQPVYAKGALGRDDTFSLAMTLHQLGRTQEATSVYKTLAERNAKDPDFLAELGSEALFSDMNDTAIDLFTRALRVDPNQTTALKGLSMAYSAVGEYSQAIESMRRYVKLRQDDAEAIYLLAEYYEAAGMNDAAAQAYSQALKLVRKETGEEGA